MGKLWLLFVFLSLGCAALNPYVGLFGVMFLSAELIIYFCMAANIKGRIRFYARGVAENGINDASRSLQRSGSALLVAWRVQAVVIFVVTAVVSCGVWLMASGRASALITAKDMMPFSVFPQEYKLTASVVLLVVGLVLNLLATIAVFARCKRFAGLLKEVQTPPVAPFSAEPLHKAGE